MGQGTPNQTTPQPMLSYDQFMSQQPRNPFPQNRQLGRQYPAGAQNMMGGEGAMGAIGQSANRFNEPLTGDALTTAQQRRSASNLMGGGDALNMAGRRGDLVGRGKGGFGGGMDMPPPGASRPRPAPMLPSYNNPRDTAVRGMPRYPGVQPANMMGGLGALRGIGNSGAEVGDGFLPPGVMNSNLTPTNVAEPLMPSGLVRSVGTEGNFSTMNRPQFYTDAQATPWIDRIGATGEGVRASAQRRPGARGRMGV